MAMNEVTDPMSHDEALDWLAPHFGGRAVVADAVNGYMACRQWPAPDGIDQMLAFVRKALDEMPEGDDA